MATNLHLSDDVLTEAERALWLELDAEKVLTYIRLHGDRANLDAMFRAARSRGWDVRRFQSALEWLDDHDDHAHFNWLMRTVWRHPTPPARLLEP